LLFWLAALHGIDGMLYYQINLWSQQCPTLRPCKSLERINGTALTDFDARTFAGGSTSVHPLTGGANGDGNLVYPGVRGPLASNRLIAIADGIEDWQLFHRLGVDTTSISHADDLIAQLVRNMTDRTSDPRLLERVRREAARRVVASERAAGVVEE